ncbi:hypothetical protein C8J56DRAFT_1024128 [Mycena floridula]|nr:hypothetical protein C8J56DRAFT_1024128 [Mycena floridula]
MRSSTSFAALSVLASVAVVTAAPYPSIFARAPPGTVQDLANKENRLQNLKATDSRLQGKENGLQNQINKDLKNGASAVKIGNEEKRLQNLKNKDANVKAKENRVGGKINADINKLKARFEEEFEELVARAPPGTVQDLANKENRLQNLKATDARLQSKENGVQNQINKDLKNGASALKIGNEEKRLQSLKNKDANVKAKETRVGGKINADINKLKARYFEEYEELVARAPPGTVKDLANKENRLQNLKATDARLQGKENGVQNQINKDLKNGASAVKIGNEEKRLQNLKNKDANVKAKENRVGGKINADLKALKARYLEEYEELVARAPPGTVKDLANKENRLQNLKATDARLQGKENGVQNQINKDLKNGASALKIGNEEKRLQSLKNKDANVKAKENRVGGKINADLKALKARDVDLLLDARDLLDEIEARGLWDDLNELD